MIIDLTRLKAGQSAEVVSIEGGIGVRQRLQNLGIMPGKKITKVNAHFWRGPVTVRVGRSNIALGFGMASKVMVEQEQ